MLVIFHAVHDMPETCVKGVGKNSIKRTLELHDEKLRVSINTIKRIVDKLLDDDVIECVNPHAASCVRFRLRFTDDGLDSFSRAVQCAQKLNVKGFKKLKV